MCWLVSYFMDWVETSHRKVERTFVSFASSIYSSLTVNVTKIATVSFVYVITY